MKTLWATALVGLFAMLATNAVYAEDAKFEDKGLTFTYPKDWKVKTDTKIKDITTILAENNKGTMVTITLNDPGIDPKLLAGELEKIKEIYKDKVVPGSDKAVKRKLLGSEREGHALEIELAKGVSSRMESFAFQTPSKKNTITVRLQTTSIDPDSKKLVDAVAESLAESKK